MEVFSERSVRVLEQPGAKRRLAPSFCNDSGTQGAGGESVPAAAHCADLGGGQDAFLEQRAHEALGELLRGPWASLSIHCLLLDDCSRVVVVTVALRTMTAMSMAFKAVIMVMSVAFIAANLASAFRCLEIAAMLFMIMPMANVAGNIAPTFPPLAFASITPCHLITASVC